MNDSLKSVIATTEVIKVGEIWVSPETLQVHFPKSCVVDCDAVQISLTDSFPIILKATDGIKYEVYAKDRKDYDIVLNRIKNKNIYNEQ